MPHQAPGRWFTLDRDYIVRDIGPAVPADIAQAAGHNIFDVFPDSEPDFRPVYEQAWRRGHARHLVYYHDTIVSLRVHARHNLLFVAFEHVTLPGLRHALDRVRTEAQAEHPDSPAAPRRPHPPQLRVIPGEAQPS